MSSDHLLSAATMAQRTWQKCLQRGGVPPQFAAHRKAMEQLRQVLEGPLAPGAQGAVSTDPEPSTVLLVHVSQALNIEHDRVERAWAGLATLAAMCSGVDTVICNDRTGLRVARHALNLSQANRIIRFCAEGRVLDYYLVLYDNWPEWAPSQWRGDLFVAMFDALRSIRAQGLPVAVLILRKWETEDEESDRLVSLAKDHCVPFQETFYHGQG